MGERKIQTPRREEGCASRLEKGEEAGCEENTWGESRSEGEKAYS